MVRCCQTTKSLNHFVEPLNNVFTFANTYDRPYQTEAQKLNIGLWSVSITKNSRNLSSQFSLQQPSVGIVSPEYLTSLLFVGFIFGVYCRVLKIVQDMMFACEPVSTLNLTELPLTHKLRR